MNKIIRKVDLDILTEKKRKEGPIYFFKKNPTIICNYTEWMFKDTYVQITKQNEIYYAQPFSNIEQLSNSFFIGIGLTKEEGDANDLKEVSILYWGEE